MRLEGLRVFDAQPGGHHRPLVAVDAGNERDVVLAAVFVHQQGIVRDHPAVDVRCPHETASLEVVAGAGSGCLADLSGGGLPHGGEGAIAGGTEGLGPLETLRFGRWPITHRLP